MDVKKEFDMRSKLMFISRNLKLFEKISVIFFVCDKPYLGLKVMQILVGTDSKALQNKTFFIWAKKQMLFGHTDWCERFAEILFMLQNHRLVKYLGFEKEEMERKFSANHKIYTDDIKIILYKLCEELNQFQTVKLIDAIERQNDSHVSNKSFNYYLELYILDLWVRNIISIERNRKINLEVLINNLESLELENKIVIEIKSTIETADFRLLKSIKSMEFHKFLPEYYSIIDASNVGLCVIINEKIFSKSDLNLKPRLGSNRDVERLREVFTAYGFRIKVHTDVVFEELVFLLNKYAKLIPATDSFFILIILSHGSENVIYTTDSVPVSMNAIELIFQADNCPNMLGKPKIFIVQSCQGQNWQKVLQGIQENVEEETEMDAPNSSVRSEVILNGPQKGDSIIAWSTVQGFASFRDKYNGSWYIEELCQELWKYGQITDFVDILTLVNNNLRRKVHDGQFMVPSLLSSLGGKIQFPFVKENWIRGREMLFKRLYFESFFSEFLCKSGVPYFDPTKMQLN